MPPLTTRPAAPAPTVPCRKFLRVIAFRPPPPAPPPGVALPAATAGSPPGVVPPPSPRVASLMVPPRSWHSAQSHPPRHAPGAAGSLYQLGALDPPRVLELGDLGRQDRAVGAVGVDAVIAGRVAAGAAAAAKDVREQRQPA